MTKLQKIRISRWLLMGSLVLAPNARADLWGGDVAVLLQILTEQVKQYYQLKRIINNGKDQMDFLRQLNSGLDNSLALLRTLPVNDEKVLSNIRKFEVAVKTIASLYGEIPISTEDPLHKVHDQTVAESLKMANDFKAYSLVQERNSEIISIQARLASPKGAARMQATTSAEILRSLSQLIRLNTQMLKLQSEQLAMTNKYSKDGVANFQKLNTDLGRGFSDSKFDMKLTRF